MVAQVIFHFKKAWKTKTLAPQNCGINPFWLFFCFFSTSIQVSATCSCPRTSTPKDLPLTPTTSTSRQTNCALWVWYPWLTLLELPSPTLWANAAQLVSKSSWWPVTIQSRPRPLLKVSVSSLRVTKPWRTSPLGSIFLSARSTPGRVLKHTENFKKNNSTIPFCLFLPIIFCKHFTILWIKISKKEKKTFREASAKRSWFFQEHVPGSTCFWVLELLSYQLIWLQGWDYVWTAFISTNCMLFEVG